MKILLIFLLGISPSLLYSQKHDNNWQVCLSIDSDPPIKYWFLNFDTSPTTLIKYFSPIRFKVSNLVMSDTLGNLLFYSNGAQIADASHSIMENGDSINLGVFWTNSGLLAPLSIFSLPAPQSDKLYYVIYCHYDTSYISPVTLNQLRYSIVDMNLNDGLGGVISVDSVMLTGTDLTYPNATKHANGRDWWIITPEWTDNIFYIQLLTPNGISDPIEQEIGPQPLPFTQMLGNKLFSPDGSKYINYDSENGIRIFDFDRCTGLLSNARICPCATLAWGGVAISPNNKFMYVGLNNNLLQYDLEAEDICATIDTVAYAEGTLSIYFPILGPDGKIYITSGNEDKRLHIIHEPNLPGDLCQVALNAIELPCYNLDGMPVFPNYRLYDLPGSPCDTLGINDPNVATTEVEEVQKVALYPNPATDMLYLSLPGYTDSEVRYSITDPAGRKVAEGSSPVFREQVSVVVKDLADGMYFISVVGDGRDGRSLKFVKRE